jgi:hypothetical protein
MSENVWLGPRVRDRKRQTAWPMPPLRRVTMNKFPVRLGVIAFLIALTMATGLVVCGHILINGPDPFAARRFDPEAWSTADSKGRAAMTRDAIRHLPTGLPEFEITKL